MSEVVRLICGKCGIEFAVPGQFDEERRANGGGWYCPNGHAWQYREPDVVKLRRERDRLKQRLAQRDDTIEYLERSASAYRGQVTRLKKRAGTGTCPCCKRHFENLARHMKAKHPEYASEPPSDGLEVIEGGKR